jgi:hypothetical protein
MSVYDIKRRQRERRRKRLRKAICTVCIIVCIVLLSILLCGTSYGRGTPEYEYHTCERLWDFVKFCPVDMDRWDYLYEVMELNGMEDMTTNSGRIYMVPIYNK